MAANRKWPRLPGLSHGGMPGDKEIVGIMLPVEPHKDLAEFCRRTIADGEEMPVLRSYVIRGQDGEDWFLRGTVTDPEDMGFPVAEFAGHDGRNNIYLSIDMALQAGKPGKP